MERVAFLDLRFNAPCALALTMLVACGGSQTGATPAQDGGSLDSGGSLDAGSADRATNSDAGTPGACVLHAPEVVHFPHADASGDKAQAVMHAIDAILASQTPPVPTAASYTIAILDCGDVSSPVTTNGYSCSFDLKLADGTTLTVSTPRPSALAEDLAAALEGAGAAPCDDFAHGTFTRLTDLAVSATSVGFDDHSSYSAPVPPNMATRGADAKGILDAFAAAGIADCDATHTLFLVCNTIEGNGAPRCGVSWFPLENVGGSGLLYSCLPVGMEPGPSLSDADSLTMWQAISTAATNAGFAPLNGTVAQASVINARSFTWDGTDLRIALTMDNPGAPPNPNH